jgi:resuscitation-promoting factor RpfB
VNWIIPVAPGAAAAASRPHPLAARLAALLCTLLLSACTLTQAGHTQIVVSITADGSTRQLSVPAGSTVLQALQQAGVTPGDLDKSTPPYYAALNDGDSIKLTRVKEEFSTEDQVIPFDQQVIRNESLPEGQTRQVQAGVNGQQEVTYRRILEDGVETSKTIVKNVILQDAVPEIMMVGEQSSFTPLPIPGKIAYLAGGNAWVMDTSTSNRRLLVNTGDLDGHIFALSPDGGYLLFTRKSKKPPLQQINTLWIVNTKSTAPSPISLNVSNVVHFAAWVPGSGLTVAYSTVEPRATAPGWQANNDLYEISLGGSPRKILDTNNGGIYGWWGESFAIAPDGHIAYARPDGIGLVSPAGGYLAPLVDITPLQTHSDWAWVPAIAWGGDSKAIYFVDHAPAAAPITDEESPNFNLEVDSLVNKFTAQLTQQVGMFAYPSASPVRQNGQEQAFQVAYLQAIFPDQSETSRYRLVAMDRDGSNRRSLFPPSDAGGLEPQTPVWAPQPIQGQTGDFVAVVYQNNLWLIDSGSAQAYQITGDGLITNIDWK